MKKIILLLATTLALSSCTTNYMGETKLEWCMKHRTWYPPFSVCP